MTWDPSITPDADTLDGELVRYLDGELDADATRRIDAIAAGNPDVAVRLATLRRRATRFHSLIAALEPATGPVASTSPTGETADAAAPAATQATADTEVSTRVRSIDSAPSARRAAPAVRSVWLRAAAIVVVVLAGALAIEPVRAWVVERIQRITGSEPVEATTAAEPAPPAAPADSLTIGFEVTVASFTIELDSHQSAGQLHVRTAAAGTRAEAEIQGRRNEGLLQLPDQLRIQNDAGSVADYVVTVPPSVRRVQVRVAGRAVATYDVAPGAAPLTISLASDVDRR